MNKILKKQTKTQMNVLTEPPAGCRKTCRDTLPVQDALDRYALVPDDSDVAVGTSGNAVALTGHVRTWAEHDAVVAAAWMAEGVMDVVDELHITG